MTVDIQNQTGLFPDATDFQEDVRRKDIEKKAAAAVLRRLACPYEAYISLMLTDEAGIRRINRDMRGIDAATDVLSFPAFSFETPGDFSFLENAHPEAFFPESGELILGDVVLSVPRAAAQAKTYGHSLLREYTFLLVHSLLHLCGYDHESPEDAGVMERLQEEILEGMGIFRA